MYSQLKSFSFMGIPNSEVLLSEKDLNSMEFNFLVRPPLEFEDDDDHDDRCVTSPLEEGADDNDDDDDDQKEEEEEEQQQHRVQELQKEEEKCKLFVSTLRIKLPSLEEFKIQEEENQETEEDGFKTPTSLDQRIPFILPCPPAPRKPKSLPSNKRKLPSRRRVLLDLSNEIESLFPPSLRADLGKKMKKVRQENEPN